MICLAISMASLVEARHYQSSPSSSSSSSSSSSPSSSSGRGNSSGCPLNALKLGACVDVLGGLVNATIGDPAVNKCCPVLQGVLEIEVALCLCTTIRAKVLNLNIILPIALELFVQCGLTPPPGFKCPPLN
ncbi:36.4 kDa proline-rich protein-like [Cryptomeria japonica]|uniref:36.4 kDa proline-rich protein-like n=1 Tax=Cryptomeria japonica TaxID=3369 RepID=UPI0025AC54D8|nr:36.4 kDa proline-rich protein-like [Cryptomeria japonica]